MKLVVIPSESIEDYEKKGLKRLREYYNPASFFDEVFVVSPLEHEKRFAHGMQIIPVFDEHEFNSTIADIKPDVVRAYGAYWASNYVALFCPAHIPKIVSIHDTNNHLFYSGPKYFDRVICMTDAVRQLAIKKGVSDNRINVMPNRVSTSDFDKSFEHKSLYDELTKYKYILHIGRRNHQKNLETVIRSLSYIPDEIILISIGLGDNRPYHKLAMELSLLDRILFIDKIDNDMLCPFYQNAIAFVLPTRWEGFGVVFIEAAAASTPIIASNISPLNEFLIDDYNSILLDDFNDPTEVAASITKIYNTPEFAHVISHNAYLMSKRFSREFIDSEEVAIYKSVIGKESQMIRLSVFEKLYLRFEIHIKVFFHRLSFHWQRLKINGVG